jgi:opacity protein-like surface antigen
MKLLILTSTMALMLMSTTTFADEPEHQHTLTTTPFYFGLDAAYIRYQDGSRELKEAVTEELDITPSVKQDRNGGAGRLFAGYTFNQNFSLELAYFKTSPYKAEATDSTAEFSSTTKVEAKGAELSALYSPSRFPNFFVKAGAVYSKVDARTRVVVDTTQASASYDDKGLGYVVGLGYKYPINELLDVKATYAYYGKIAGENDSYLNLLSLGVQYHF